MRSDTFLKLAQHRMFWRFRALVQRRRFRLLSRIFQLRYFVRDERANAGILLSFLTLTTGQLLLAFSFAGALQVLELVLVPFLVSRWPIPDSANYVTWLSSLAQIGGVFIALYFTAVTAAAGAIYAQVPNNVRDLLTRERVGNIYIRYLTLTTFLPLCLIALHLFGLEPLRLALPVLVAMAGMGIVAFATLGRRAFDLFDPTRLAGSLFGDLGRWLDQVAAGGFRWRDHSFQSNAHRQASSILECLSTLSDLAATHENLESGPLLEFSTRILLLLAHYQDRKLEIPTDSVWFEQKYQHKTWYMTEDTTTTLAHSTGTSLSPNAVPQYNWVEDRLEPIPLKCFELNIRRKRLDNLRDLLSAGDAYITALVKNGNLVRAAGLLKQMCGLWEQAHSGALSNGESESAEELGIADALCFLRLRILVAYRTLQEQTAPERTAGRLGRVSWKTAESLYSAGFASYEIRQLEWMHPRVQMELDVEGSIKTPMWYTQDLISKLQMESLIENVDFIIEESQALHDWSERLVKDGRVWQSSAILVRRLEYLNKLAAHLPFFMRLFESLKAARHLTDLQWPELDTQRWQDKTKAQHIELTRSMAQHLVLLSSSKKMPAGIPDYFGQFMHETAEALFKAMFEKRTQDIPALFPQYLMGTLTLFEQIKPTAPKPDVWTEQKLQIAAAPVLDLLELSGYAKLLGELYGDKELWTGITTYWDKLLEINPGILPWLTAVTNAGLPRFQIPHRGLVRNNWSMRVQRELNQVQRRSTLRGRSSRIYTSDEVKHPSPLVRYCARHHYFNGWEIFVSSYLSKQPGAEGLEWGPGPRDLDESLGREERSYHTEAQENPDDF